MDNFSKEFVDGEIEFLDKMKAICPPREVASGAQPRSGSASATGCRDARASSNQEADSSVIVETKADSARKETLSGCQWKSDDIDGGWDTECGEKFCFMADGPKENGYRFCPHCGKPIALAAGIEDVTAPTLPPAGSEACLDN